MYNPETARIYYFRYMREYRAVCVLWALLTIIWCILNVVAFIQPHWIGDTDDDRTGYGHIGVFQYCKPDSAYQRYVCDGSFTSFNSILNDAFRATTFFCGVSALLMLIVVAALLLFFCFKKTIVFYLCGILELISAVFMFLACVIFPSGWDHQEVRNLCGSTADQYKLGYCGVRWGYILAILGIFDAALLAILAFVLASKREEFPKDSYVTGTVNKSELEGYNVDTMSKRSIPIQPVVTVPGGDDRHERFSEYSQSQFSRRPGHNNFQL